MTALGGSENSMTSRVTDMQRVRTTTVTKKTGASLFQRFCMIGICVFLVLGAAHRATIGEWWMTGLCVSGGLVWALNACVASTLTVTIGGDDAAD